MMVLGRACAVMASAFTGRDCVEAVDAGIDRLAAEVDEVSFESVLRTLAGRCRGNRSDYYDPRNSFLDEVVRRGVGIPISLSVVAIEMGRRIGVDLDAVGLPGHVVVRDGRREVYGDPFQHGRLFDRPGLVTSWRRLVGSDVPFDDVHLAPMSDRMILIRMLNNLREIYLRSDDARALYSLAVMRGAFAELADEAPAYARWVRAWN
jgi:regulator of sirC expression with transglutaminase-like and TPR domain